jgi:isoquinoline 1-oxidoreductase alpha subunit
MTTIDLSVNGVDHVVDGDPQMPLLWALRDLLALTGTKYGCGVGECGACTVHLDGAAVHACTTTVGAARGRRITTIEGLAEAGGDKLQEAWVAEAAAQCGYCQPGQLMAAAALLRATPAPTDAEIDAAMDGNLCRCGTYLRIRRAIHRAAGTIA